MLACLDPLSSLPLLKDASLPVLYVTVCSSVCVRALVLHNGHVWFPVCGSTRLAGCNNRMFGYLCRCLGLARVVQKASFSQALQIRGNRAFPGGQASLIHEVHVERLRTAKKSSAQRRTGQPNSVCLQPVWTDASNQTQRPCMCSAWP